MVNRIFRLVLSKHIERALSLVTALLFMIYTIASFCNFRFQHFLVYREDQAIYRNFPRLKFLINRLSTFLQLLFFFFYELNDLACFIYDLLH